MVRRGSLFLTVLLALSSTYGNAQEPGFGVEFRQDVESSVEDSELTRLSSEITASLTASLGEAGDLFVEVEGIYEATSGEGTLELGEAFLSFYLPTSDLVVGRQIINWGTADGLNPASMLNPLVVESFVEEELRWEPVLALRSTTYLGSVLTAGAAIILDFVPLDAEGLSAERPEPRLEHLEYGARLDARVGTVDLRSTYFYGWEDLPAMTMEVDLDAFTLQPIPGTESPTVSYRREHRFGLAATGELLTVGIWGEAAYVLPEELDVISTDPLRPAFALSSNEPRWEAVVGLDYTLPFGLYAESQYAYYGEGSWVAPYGVFGSGPESTHLVMARLSYSIGLNSSLAVVGFVDVGRENGLVVPSVTFGLAPAASLRLAGTIPVGAEKGFTAAFPTAVRATAIVNL